MADDDSIERRRAAKAAYRREYRERNKERLRADWQRWDAENKERRAEYQRAARAADPDKFAAKQKRWRDKNPEYHADWRAENAERQAELQRQWVRDNPDAARAKTHRRLARKRQAEGTFDGADTVAIRERQQDCCAACGCDLCGGGELDHIIPLSRNGTNWPSNLQWLCRFCNRSKHTLTMDEFILLRGGRRG